MSNSVGRITLVILASIIGVSTITVGSAAEATDSGMGVVRPLTLVEIAIPKAPCYETAGSYPQIVANSQNLDKVSARISAKYLDDERRFIALGMQNQRQTKSQCPGLYDVWNKPSFGEVNNKRVTLPSTFQSASSRVVSVMSPINAAVPSGAATGGYFVSITVNVVSNSVVALPQLFAHPRPAYALLKKEVVRGCVKEYGSYFCTGASQELAPVSTSFRNFSLSGNGLVIGSDGETIAPFSVETIISYASIEPYLSPLGQWLITGVTAPRK